MVPFDILNDEMLTKIFTFLRYADIANLLITNKKLNELVITIIHDYTIPNLDRDIYKGIIIILNRYSPDRGLGEDTPQGAPAINQQIYEDVIRALGWRKFSSALKLNKAAYRNRITLSTLRTQIIAHAQLTSKLRALAVHESFPQRNYISKKNSYPYLKEEDVKLLTDHWKSIYNQIGDERDYHANDTLALSLATNEGLMGGGQNVSVVGGAPSLIYTNNPLAAGKVHDLESKYSPHTVAGISQEGHGARNGLGAEHGVGRKYGTISDLPFHSEMLRLLNKEPWELSYAGNSYLACAQCLVSYFAIGVTLFRGSHLQKVPSIIPPRIRQNTVYLEQYLGEPLFRKITAEFGEDLSQLTSFLDYVERYDKNFYEVYKVQEIPDIDLMGSKTKPHTPPPAMPARSAPVATTGLTLPVGGMSSPGAFVATPALGPAVPAFTVPAAVGSPPGYIPHFSAPIPPVMGAKRIFSATVPGGTSPSPSAGPPKHHARTCVCGARMVIKNGVFGRFYGCPMYPACKHTENL